ncbi:MAG: alpha/beta fold hydrolase, partial [Candidatus Thorarchaeota archaeon]
MSQTNLLLDAQNEWKIFVNKWTPENEIETKGILLILHGVGEYSDRYTVLAQELIKEGYTCFAPDLRGHGKSIKEGKLGYMGKEGWLGVINDIKLLLDKIKNENPEKPIFLYGHSNGSFFAQDIIEMYPHYLSGVIMSATCGKQKLLNLAHIIGKILVAFKGLEGQSDFMYNLSIGAYNNDFKKENMKNAWISTIRDEVIRYNNDPMCGFKPPNQYFLEVSTAMKRFWNNKNMKKIPKNLPILILNGSEDPLSQACKDLY